MIRIVNWYTSIERDSLFISIVRERQGKDHCTCVIMRLVLIVYIQYSPISTNFDRCIFLSDKNRKYKRAISFLSKDPSKWIVKKVHNGERKRGGNLFSLLIYFYHLFHFCACLVTNEWWLSLSSIDQRELGSDDFLLIFLLFAHCCEMGESDPFAPFYISYPFL